MASKQSFEDFFLIVPEEGELPEENGYDEDNDLITKDQDRKAQQEFPAPVCFLGIAKPLGKYAGNPGSGGTGYGKCADV